MHMYAYMDYTLWHGVSAPKYAINLVRACCVYATSTSPQSVILSRADTSRTPHEA